MAKVASRSLLYALATLHGEHGNDGPPDEHLHNKNRETWNRWSASALTTQQRLALGKDERVKENELVPFSPDELKKLQIDLSKRIGAERPVELPDANDDINFAELIFETTVSMSGFLFATPTNFSRSQFAFPLDLTNTTFKAPATFIDMRSSKSSSFNDAYFQTGADFSTAILETTVEFTNATFAHIAKFEAARFNGSVSFSEARFVYLANFENANFIGLADFREAVFFSEISFDNTNFSAATLYSGAKFHESPPGFFGSSLHQNTDWLGIAWPTPKTPETANSYVRAYERLKLEMDSLRKIDDELNFLALELQCKAVRDGGARGWLIRSYGLISNYGRSIWRPLFCMFLVWLAGFLSTYLSYTLTPGRAAAISASNLVGFFGFNRAYIETGVLQNMPEWAKFLFAGQTLLAAPLLFLALLALRNRFRIK